MSFNKTTFSKYTEKIKAQLPFWFSMKKKPNDSVGLDFLNVFGLHLDDIENMLNYANKQYFIDTADIFSCDIVYKVNLPSYYNPDEISGVYSSKDALKEVSSLYEFFGIEDRINNITHAYEQNNIFFIDHLNKVIFVREAYDRTNESPYGKINVRHLDIIKEYSLIIHHVWNFFDEFGALVGCSRLKEEKNESYKKRILDVFKNPANSTKLGLANGIARELNVRKYKTWEDMSIDFIIKDKMVIVDTISIDNSKVSNIYMTDEGYLCLKGDIYKKGINSEVSYICGISIEPLIEKSQNVSLSNELFESDGSPTQSMIRYVNKIDTQSSVLWNNFIYNETIWIKDSEDYYSNHFSFLPSRYDAKIGGFENYGYVE